MAGATLTNDMVTDQIINRHGGTMIIEGMLKDIGKLTNYDKIIIDKGCYFCLGNFNNVGEHSQAGKVSNFGRVDNISCPTTFTNSGLFYNQDYSDGVSAIREDVCDK